MEWNEKYCLGVERIDQQHKGLFTAINRILRILAEEDRERSRRACVEAIKYLKSYTQQHFADEEAYQREIGYEGYEKHKALHDAFIVAVTEKEADMIRDDYSRDSVRRLTDVVTAWLTQHIMSADQAIVRSGGAA